MKKITLILFMLFTALLSGQTTFKTYTVPVIGTSKVIKSILYGNCMYNVYSTFNQMAIQKNDLNGVPLMTKIYFINGGPVDLNTKGGALYISGLKQAAANGQQTPFLAKVDTSNLSFIYCNEYLFLSNSIARIFQTKFLNDGNLMMCGGVIPTTYYSALTIKINPTNGSVIYTNTLVVGAPTASFVTGPPTYFTSFAEISNSTILFSGGTDYLGGFLTSAAQTPPSITTNSVFLCSSGAADLSASTANPAQVVAYDNSKFFKLDTSLSLIGSTLPGSDLTYSVNGTSRTFYNNGRVYVIHNSIDLDIYDDSFIHLYGSSYPFIAAGYSNTAQMNIGWTGNVMVNNSNIFITSAVTQDNNKTYMIKTNPDGSMPCYVPKPVTRTAVSHTSMPSVFNSGPISYTVNPLNFSASASSVSYVTNICSPTQIKESLMNASIKVMLNDYGYSISGLENISSYELYDINGRIIKKEVIKEESSRIDIDLTPFSRGIYVIKLTDNNLSEHKIKLVH